MNSRSSAAETIKYKLVHPTWHHHFYFSHQTFGPMRANYPRHNHDFFEFFLVESGKVIHQINGFQEILRPGDLRFILPGDTHQLLPEKGKKFTICMLSPVLFLQLSFSENGLFTRRRKRKKLQTRKYCATV